jgi:OmcA/MtrC family decaheme c-type cytochrome
MPTASAIPPPAGPAGAGLVSDIQSVTIDQTTGQVVATFTLTDASGVPLTATSSSAENDQQARVRLTIARVESYDGGGDLANTFLRYVNEIDQTQPGYDSNGTFAFIDATNGVYQYTFATHLGSVQPQATYTVGMQVDRDFQGQELSANPIFDVVPAGGTPQVWEDTTTAQCNVCHAPLIAHGNRREVRLCKLCHTEAAVADDGSSIDFRHMIHMIHAGTELPSIVDGPVGSKYAIGDNVFAEKQPDGSITGVTFPRPIEECITCHGDGPTADFSRTKPSAPACATCHDDVNPSQQATSAGPPGTNHKPGAYADGQCSACHSDTQSKEFDISVPGAHVVPEQSTQLQGLNLSILDVANHVAGQPPTIHFRIADNAGNPLRDVSGLSTLSFNMAGPTTDYAQVFTLAVLGSNPGGTLTGPDGEGVFQFVAGTAIPASATGSWSLGAEARRTVQLTSSVSATEAAPNPVVSFPVDDSQMAARRMVVENQNCFSCHGEFSKGFSIHGGSRNRVEYCVLCHNPNASDAARRSKDPAAVAASSPTSTIDFKVLIHKIHRGDDLTQQPYLVYGFGSGSPGYTIHDFGQVQFPGDLRDCEKCHAQGTELMPPFPGTALGTELTHLNPSNGSEVVDGRLGPITSVCTSCHDDDAARAHADSETASNGQESCPVCHSEGRDFAVSMLHAGRN